MKKCVFCILSVLVVVFTSTTLQAQCPIVDDTFYVDNVGSPIYINYLRNATNQGLRTQVFTPNSTANYAWAHSSNIAPNQPTIPIETQNKHFLNGAADISGYTAVPQAANPITQITPGPVTPGVYSEYGQYASPVATTMTDKVVKLQIPTNFYGFASFDYHYESCQPWTNYYVQPFVCCAQWSAVVSTVTVSCVPTATVFLGIYPCAYYGGVCSSYSYEFSCQYQYIQVSQICLSTGICGQGVSEIDLNSCAPNRTGSRTTCTKKITLYVRAPLDVQLTKNCGKSSYAADEPIKFTIMVSSPLYSEVVDSGYVQDVLPAGLSLVSYSTNGGTYDPQTGIWNLPPIGNGKSYTMTVTALATETKTFTNTATFRFANRLDYDSTNNSMSCSFTATASSKQSIKPAYPCSIFTQGTSPICSDTSGIVFAIQPITVSGVTYQWTVPTGFSIQSGQGTNSITVKAGTSPGVISVNVFIPATATTSATTCERSFPVAIKSFTSDIRIRKP